MNLLRSNDGNDRRVRSCRLLICPWAQAFQESPVTLRKNRNVPQGSIRAPLSAAQRAGPRSDVSKAINTPAATETFSEPISPRGVSRHVSSRLIESQSPQTVFLVAQDEQPGAIPINFVDVAMRVLRSSEHPQARGLGYVDGLAQVRRMRERHKFQSPRSDVVHRSVERRGAIAREQDSGHPEKRCRSKDGADIMRILQLVERPATVAAWSCSSPRCRTVPPAEHPGIPSRLPRQLHRDLPRLAAARDVPCARPASPRGPRGRDATARAAPPRAPRPTPGRRVIGHQSQRPAAARMSRGRYADFEWTATV